MKGDREEGTFGVSKNALPSAALFQKIKKVTYQTVYFWGQYKNLGHSFPCLSREDWKQPFSFMNLTGQYGFIVIIPASMPCGWHYLADVSEENVQIWQ